MFEAPDGKVERDRSRVVIVTSAIAVAVVIALIVIVGSCRVSKPEQVSMALSGSPEFDSYVKFIEIGKINKHTGVRLNTNYSRLVTTIRNAGDRTLTGLQIRPKILGFNWEILKERVVTVVPGQQDELGPGRSINVEIFVEPSPAENEIMEMQMEVAGLKLKDGG